MSDRYALIAREEGAFPVAVMARVPEVSRSGHCDWKRRRAGDLWAAELMFHADAPDRLWLTDITEFSPPLGKTCLPPILNCLESLGRMDPTEYRQSLGMTA